MELDTAGRATPASIESENSFVTCLSEERESISSSRSSLKTQDQPSAGPARRMTEWQARKKHFIILTEDGKPLFSRYEDPEEDSANVAGFMKGLLSKTESIDGKFRYMDCGNVRIVTFRENDLIYVTISKTGETVSYLYRQLKALHGIIICTVSGTTLRNQATYDLSRELLSADAPLRCCIRSLNRTPAFMCNSVPLLPMPEHYRQLTKECLAPCASSKELLWAAVVAGNELIAFQRGAASSDSPVHAFDVLTVTTFIQSQSTIYSGNASLPCWFPQRDPEKYVHAFVGYVGSVKRHRGRTSVPTAIRKSDQAAGSNLQQSMIGGEGDSEPAKEPDELKKTLEKREQSRRRMHPHLHSLHIEQQKPKTSVAETKRVPTTPFVRPEQSIEMSEDRISELAMCLNYSNSSVTGSDEYTSDMSSENMGDEFEKNKEHEGSNSLGSVNVNGESKTTRSMGNENLGDEFEKNKEPGRHEGSNSLGSAQVDGEAKATRSMGSAYPKEKFIRPQERKEKQYYDNMLEDVLIILVTDQTHMDTVPMHARLKDKVQEKLKSNKAIERITHYVESTGLECHKTGVSGLLHFVFIDYHKGQFVQSLYPERFARHKRKKWLLRRYDRVYDRLTSEPTSVQYVVDDTSEYPAIVSGCNIRHFLVLATFSVEHIHTQDNIGCVPAKLQLLAKHLFSNTGKFFEQDQSFS